MTLGKNIVGQFETLSMLPYVNKNATQCINTLLLKINNFSLDTSNVEDVICDDSVVIDKLLPGRYTENDFLSLADASPFKKWRYEICWAVDASFHNVNGKRNMLHCESLAEHLLTKCIPLFPMWSFVVDTDMSTSSLPHNNCHSSRSNGTIENWCRVLKHLCLGSKKNSRVDDFSSTLFTQILSTQKFSPRSF